MTETLTALPNAESETAIPNIKEIEISIFANNIDPSMVSPNFLISTGIIPGDWALTRQPVLNANLAQLNFQNGLNIVARPRMITFSEGIGQKESQDLKSPGIAHTYVEKLPNAQYQRLNIMLKFLVILKGELETARKYLTETLLAPGPWQDFGQAPVEAGINFLYELGECQLNLSVNQAQLQQVDKPTMPALLFSGNFNYNLASDTQEEVMVKLLQGLDNWRNNLETFQEIVNQRFLAQQEHILAG